jgi:antitoxin component of RelBE/YafQ-DinJ toxin-antitoxin module
VTKCVPVRIDDKLASQLSIWADGMGVPLSQAIRDILSDFVAERVAEAISRASLRHTKRIDRKDGAATAETASNTSRGSPNEQ